MEKFQYGMQVTYQVEEVLQEFKTAKTHVKYVRTKYHGDMLFMDDEIQFSTLDEHRYHDLLVPSQLQCGSSVLILGGGDGLALRNVYRNSPSVKRAIVVDWDKEFVEKFAINYERNEGSLKDSRTIMVYMDALEFLRIVNETFDVIIIDLPDPDGSDMEELYLKIIRSTLRIMHEDTEITCHVGPLSLCKEHPNWTFVKKFIGETGLSSVLSCNYIPSFSHEWGVVYFNTDWDISCKQIKEIDEIYKQVKYL